VIGHLQDGGQRAPPGSSSALRIPQEPVRPTVKQIQRTRVRASPAPTHLTTRGGSAPARTRSARIALWPYWFPGEHVMNTARFHSSVLVSIPSPCSACSGHRY
jgi:hypothetical protein